MYSIYVVFNKDNRKIYIGQTENLEERVRLHNEKKFAHSYTARYSGSWVLIYSEEVTDRATALAREKQLKSFRGREFIKQYIPV